MSGITLRQLEFFCAAANGGSISRAAEALHLAQPSVSEQLRKLERAVGAALLLRTNQGLRLTAAGRDFQLYAERTLAAAAEAVAAVQPTHRERDQLVSFGTFNSAHAYFLGDVVTLFRARHPDVRLRITTQNSTEIAEHVRDGELELGLVALPVDVRGLQVSSVVWRSQAVYVTAVGAVCEAPRTIEEVVTAPLVLPEIRQGNNDPTRRQLRQRAAAAGLAVSPIIEVEHGSTVLDLVARGVGDTVLSLPLVHVLGYADRVRCIPLDPPLIETFAFVTRRGTRVRAPAADLIQLAIGRLQALEQLAAVDQQSLPSAQTAEALALASEGECACDSA